MQLLNNILNFNLLITLTVIMLCFNGCKKDTICNDPTDPNCKNYDPCYGKTPVSADFGIYEGINGAQAFNEADTIFIYSYVLLKTKNVKAKDINVTWKVRSVNSYNKFNDTA